MTVACPDCGATWVGRDGDPCQWCERALARMLEDRRREVLWPAWMAEQGPRYDELDEDSKAVWDRTRGITRGSSSVDAWRRRLAVAVLAGIVEQNDAHRALQRAQKARAA